MRGLLMIEPLYHQTVAGNKTQTRRSGGLESVNETPDKWTKIGHTTYIGGEGYPDKFGIGVNFVPAGLGLIKSCMVEQTICKPRYKIGEVLYLKEPTAKAKVINGKQIYAYLYGCNGHKGMISEFKWENKLFMPADRARAFIKITNIKCERLMDISGEDCVAEGIESKKHFTTQTHYRNYMFKNKLTPNMVTYFDQPKDSFISLFRFANKIKPSAEIGNPWVWAYSFELVKNYTHEQK